MRKASIRVENDKRAVTPNEKRMPLHRIQQLRLPLECCFAHLRFPVPVLQFYINKEER